MTGTQDKWQRLYDWLLGQLAYCENINIDDKGAEDLAKHQLLTNIISIMGCLEEYERNK